ncbi:hypothetical protein [Chryseobacterium sp.]|uniref:hypothetical protein n=1 Tax=Chryseobacterium sp. TaxID=1871047 RepID=UPI002FC6238D
MKFNKEKKGDSFWVVFFSVIFMLLFLGMGGGGVYYSYSKFSIHLDLVSNGIKTGGNITGYEESWSKDDDGGYTKMYSPIIRYYDTSNKSHELLPITAQAIDRGPMKSLFTLTRITRQKPSAVVFGICGFGRL